MRSILWSAGVLVALAAVSTHGEIVTETIEYEHDGVKLAGYLAYDDKLEGKRPGVLIVHEWWGLNDYAKRRARQVAELGYVAFALDMYGKGKVTTEREQAQKWSGELYGKPLMRTRAKAGLDVLAQHERVDPKRIAAMGYCFGGTTVLQLAFSGADIAGVVSFHGNPAPPADHELLDIKAKILVCHGASDAFTPAKQIAAFKDAMTRGRIDWQMIYYGGAVHSFTNRDSGKAGIKGVAYNKPADRRSWQHMRSFFSELFSEHKDQASKQD